jgi:hypothetical protein
MSVNLGTNKLEENLNYLINNHPQIFLINQLLYNIKNNPTEIDKITESL